MPRATVGVAAACVALLAGGALLQAQTRKPKPGAQPSPQGFAVEIEQDGALVPHVKHEVRLKRAPFTIILHSPDLEGAYLNASFEPDLFEIASMGLPFGNRLRTGMTVAETHMNPEHELIPGLDSLHYLDYKDKTYVRMDQVTPVGAGFRGRRTVSGFYFGDKSHPIAEVADRPLYLLMARGKPHPDTGALFTSDYEYLKLVFDKP
jgi:hypothetical protein